MLSQKDSVFAAFEEGTAQGLQEKELSAFASAQVALGLMNGEVEHSTPEKFVGNEKDSNKYAKELVSNWFKRDKRINGGVKYVPETKRGPVIKNPELKELLAAQRKLAKIGNDEAHTVLEMIAPRITELSTIEQEAREVKKAAAPKKEISVDSIMQSLIDKGFIQS